MSRRKNGGLFLAVYLLAATPALAETSREAAEVVAARHARTCYVEMMDGQLKCGGRPRRSLAAARALLGPGTLAKPDDPPSAGRASPPGYSNGEASQIKRRSPSMRRPGS